MKNNESNSEFLTRLMEFSNSGAMMQMVIMQALIDYTEKLTTNRAGFLKAMEKNQMISGEGWMAAVDELKAEIDRRMPPSKKKG